MRNLMLFIFFTPISLIGQRNEFGNWLMYFGDKKINSRINWHHEVQYRDYNFITDMEQLLLRTGIGYNLTDNNNNIHIGYSFVKSKPFVYGTSERKNFNEHRTYQQFISKQVFGRFALQHRYRFEQRIFEDAYHLRLRYFLSTNIALNRKQMEDKTIYLSAYNEVFINTKLAYFDRNRIYFGLGYRFSKYARTEAGIMNQTANNIARNQFNLMMFLNL